MSSPTGKISSQTNHNPCTTNLIPSIALPNNHPNLTARQLSLYYHSKYLPTIEDLELPKGPKNLTIIHHNARSLNKRNSHYATINTLQTCDIFCVSETFLKPSIPSNHVSLAGFTLERTDRSLTSTKGLGGGAAVYVRNSLEYERLPEPSKILNTICYSVWIKISTTKSKPVVVAAIYRAPDTNVKDFHTAFSRALDTTGLDDLNLIIMGDFNINWCTKTQSKLGLQNILAQQNLKQTISGPTYVSPLGNESTIDLALISANLPISKTGVALSDLSDHYFTYVVVNLNPKKLPRKLINIRSFHTLDEHEFYQKASMIPFHNIPHTHNCPSLQANLLESSIQSLLDTFIPSKTIRVRESKPVWLTNDLVKLIRIKNTFFKKVFKQNNIPSTKSIEQYKKFRNYVSNQIRTEKKKIIQANLAKDTSTFFKTARNLLGTQTRQGPPTNIKVDNKTVPVEDVANAFNKHFLLSGNTQSTLAQTQHIIIPQQSNSQNCNFQTILDNTTNFNFQPIDSDTVFSELNRLKNKKGGMNQTPASIYKLIAPLIAAPLASIFNNSIKNNTFPDCYKVALVNPIFKKGNVKNIQNYRPISSLPILSKVFEKILHSQLSIHLEKNNLLSERQFGFRKHHSTEQMLLTLLETWLTKLDSSTPCYISAISIDVSKAFDSINHSILLKMLPSFKLTQSTTALIESYLSNRSQVVRIDNLFSNPGSIVSGVPQGSVLGPLLFNLFVNNMLTNFNQALAYADDTIIYEISSSQLDSSEKATTILHQLTNWYTAVGLKLNLKKTKYCVFSNRKIDHRKHLKIPNTVIPLDSTLDLLGIKLDSKLSFSDHCTNLSNKVTSTLTLFRRCRKYLDLPQALDIYLTIIRPRLEYCPLLLTHMADKNSNLIEKCQNKAIRIILQAPTIFSITDGRSMLNLSTLKSRRYCQQAKLIDKVAKLKNISPALLNVINAPLSHKHNLRNSCKSILPSFRTDYGKRTFNYNFILRHKTIRNPPHSLLSFST